LSVGFKCKIARKAKEYRPFGRPVHIWENNIKMAYMRAHTRTHTHTHTHEGV